MNNIETLVDVELEDRLNEMSNLDPTGDGYKAREDVTIKLLDRKVKIEELKNQAEANKLKEKELDLQATKLKQEDEESKKKRLTETVLKSVELVGKYVIVPGFAIGLTVFEMTDSNTTTPTKEFWKKVFRLT